MKNPSLIECKSRSDIYSINGDIWNLSCYDIGYWHGQIESLTFSNKESDVSDTLGYDALGT
jgi:hypothetical protein